MLASKFQMEAVPSLLGSIVRAPEKEPGHDWSYALVSDNPPEKEPGHDWSYALVSDNPPVTDGVRNSKVCHADTSFMGEWPKKHKTSAQHSTDIAEWKEGDEVLCLSPGDCIKIFAGGWFKEMLGYVGKVGRIASSRPGEGCVIIRFDDGGCKWAWDKRFVERV